MLRELWDTATRPARPAEDGSWARAAAALARGEGAMRFCSTLRDEDGAALARAAAHGAPSGPGTGAGVKARRRTGAAGQSLRADAAPAALRAEPSG